MTSDDVLYNYTRAKCSLDTVDRDKSRRRAESRVFKLPHGGVGIKRDDRVAPNNPPRLQNSAPIMLGAQPY